jgi:hypothetical protein
VPNKSYDDEFDLLMSFLAESIARMSDSQIEEEFGKRPKARTKEILRAELSSLRKEKLRRARADYESVAKELMSRSYDLPASRSERRILLSSILSQRPELHSLTFTAQHRELRNLTDSDIESLLRQLAELGLLDPFVKGK